MRTLLSIDPPQQSAGPESWIGHLLDGRYRMLELLAEGGMGAVFIAEHTGLGKRVALKLVRPEFTSDQVFVDRFHREAMATAHLDHPNIAKAIDYGTLDNGDAYLVMQLIHGRSLGEVIASGERLPWRKVCELGAQISSALAAAHGIGIVHRDLKPDNVIVEGFNSKSPQAKVLDFGVARIQDARSLGVPERELTSLGSVIGTPGYMAPEQACGGVATAACDLYSLGVILWELLTGRSLWKADTVTELFTAQLTEDPPSPSLHVPLPAALEVLILQLLDREPKRRPASARDLSEVFREFAVTRESNLQRNDSDDLVPDPHALPRRFQLGLLVAAALILAAYLAIAT